MSRGHSRMPVVDTLLIKCRRALQQGERKTLVVAGGVGANKHLRRRMQELDADVFFPRHEFCTDNGAMIAYAGALRLQAGANEPPVIQPRPRWPLTELDVIQQNDTDLYKTAVNPA